ncbi:hypothetical protein [Vibrio hepatarius]|uniref:hypothetical protein n=1 Tax=Vibrio hepatarius TaxID=171383 RepID=UPI00148E6FC2|nr:hypothetical protein [Vibrio hepatarius]NOI15811.1 hypothetical protein [Vibrio hepatarius]
MIGNITDCDDLVSTIKNAMHSCKMAKNGNKLKELDNQKALLLTNYALPKEIVNSIGIYAMMPFIKTDQTCEEVLTKLFEQNKALKQLLEDELNAFCSSHGTTLSSLDENTKLMLNIRYNGLAMYFLVKPYVKVT